MATFSAPTRCRYVSHLKVQRHPNVAPIEGKDLDTPRHMRGPILEGKQSTAWGRAPRKMDMVDEARLPSSLKRSLTLSQKKNSDSELVKN